MVFFIKITAAEKTAFRPIPWCSILSRSAACATSDCDLVDVSSNGIAIHVPASESIVVGMDVSLEICVPGSLDQMTVSGRVHRVLRGEKILAGIKFDIPLEVHVLDRLILR